MIPKSASKCATFLLLAAGMYAPAIAQMPSNCIADKSGFKGKAYVVELANLCELHVRCKINAYVVTSRGPTRGRKTLTLAPASKGAAAHKVYIMKLTEAGGTADVSRQCKVF